MLIKNTMHIELQIIVRFSKLKFGKPKHSPMCSYKAYELEWELCVQVHELMINTWTNQAFYLKKNWLYLFIHNTVYMYIKYTCGIIILSSKFDISTRYRTHTRYLFQMDIFIILVSFYRKSLQFWLFTVGFIMKQNHNFFGLTMKFGFRRQHTYWKVLSPIQYMNQQTT